MPNQDKRKNKAIKLLQSGATDNELVLFEHINDLEDKFDETVTKLPDLDKVLESVRGADGDKGEQGIDGKKGDKGDPGESIKGENGRDGRDGRDGIDGESIKGIDGKDGTPGTNGVDGKDGSPDTPDQVVDKVNESEKQINPERVKGLKDIESIAKANQVAVPVTTSFFNGLRAKNLTIDGATATQKGDTVHITGISGGSGSQTPWTSDIDGGGYNLSNVNTISATNLIYQSGAYGDTGNDGGWFSNYEVVNTYLEYQAGAFGDVNNDGGWRIAYFDSDSGAIASDGAGNLSITSLDVNGMLALIDHFGNYGAAGHIHINGEIQSDWNGSTQLFQTDGSGHVTAASFIKASGTSSQFLKADGSVDSSTYLTSSSLTNYVQGPASATDGVFAMYDGTTGKLIKNSTYNASSFIPSANQYIDRDGTNGYLYPHTLTDKFGIGTNTPTQNLDMVAGGKYGYNGSILAQAVTVSNDWFLAGAGNLTLSGSSDTGIGVSTLGGLTSGNENTAIGYNALTGVSTGSYNTAFGAYSGGSGNQSETSAFGRYTLFNNSGTSNTGVGNTALFNNSSGTYNVGIGKDAGRANTTGNFNTYIGFQAGYSDGSVSTTNNLTNASAFGYNAQVTTSNSLILGGTGAYAVQVGIGTATPTASAVLDVASTTGAILVPRMTTTQKNALTPTAGMIVYDTTLALFQGYEGGAWKAFSVL